MMAISYDSNNVDKEPEYILVCFLCAPHSRFLLQCSDIAKKFEFRSKVTSSHFTSKATSSHHA